jgi:hypothetical protein
MKILENVKSARMAEFNVARPGSKKSESAFSPADRR